MSLKLHETTQRVPQKVLKTSRKLDECKPLEEGEEEDMLSPEEAAAVRCDARLALLRVSSVGRCRLTR
jgi:hypothetical protein